MDLRLPPYDPDRPSRPYRRQNCTDQYDARAMGQHALDAGMFDAFDSDDMEGEGKAEYNAGVIAYERGDLDEAAQHFMKALSMAPDAGPARNNLAIVLYQQGDHETALGQFKRLAQAHPDQPNVLRNYGVSLWLNGQPREALEQLERASELDPEDGELHFLRSRLHGDLDETDKMIECMRRAAEVEPQSAGAVDNLGVVLQNSGMIDEAIEQFQRAHELEPDNPLPLYNLGQALYAADRNEEAVEVLLKHIAMRPEHSCAHYELARALSELGRHDEGLKHFKAYEDLEPGDPAGICSVGTEMGLMGKGEEGDAHVRKALDLDPGYHWAVHALGLLAKGRGELELAAAYHEEAVRRDPEHVIFQRAFGEAYGRVHSLEETITRLKALPQQGDPSVWLRLMTTLRDEHRAADALAVGHAALQLYPREGPLLGTLALAQDDLGERELALKTLRQTTAINPDDLIAHFHAGRILAETGEFAKACAALEYVSEHDKDSVRPREYLLFCYANLEQYDRCDAIAEEILRLDPENAYLKDLFEEREKEAGEGESGEGAKEPPPGA